MAAAADVACSGLVGGGGGGAWQGALGRGRSRAGRGGPAAIAMAVSFREEAGAVGSPPPKSLLDSLGAPNP